MLNDFRALDLTDIKGHMCGRFLADLGMEVIKLEPPAGDPARRIGPFASSGTSDSLRFAHLNVGKKSVVLDYRDPANRERILDLVSNVDVLIESSLPGELDSLGIGHAELMARNPALVIASITGYGQTGPRRHFADSDIVIYALSGLMSIAGNPGRTPCKPPETQAWFFGSLMASLGIVSALYKRESTQTGDWVDISMLETLASQESLIRMAANEGKVLKRQGSKHAHIAPAKIFPCRDGYVYLYVNGAQWKKFLEVWSDHPEELDDPALAAEPVRHAKADFINEQIEHFTCRYGKDELSALLQSHRIPCTPVKRPAEWLKDEQVLSRSFLQPARLSGHSDIVLVAAPFLLNGKRSWPGTVPALGQDQEILGRLAGRTGQGP